ncbi:hypothetical protein KFL_000320110 [Klebsormidium nitens]|uniref:SAGA-associated factor 11 n=1 Tax=Klebsormidium nitens TaxID=105231 RepID=A0A1Y1HP04_KLENI|nr:hypothetical protein KFL_000320110 [Klebsormidium nitens]|eukprot:GAQ79512.1 hypothetical protein KFL_000320110 [Klebsormidium nitens]
MAHNPPPDLGQEASARPVEEQILEIYEDLLDGFLVDIASEVHREAALGPAARPPDERPPLPEPSLPPGLPPIPVAKIPKDCRVDVFGQIIPPVPTDKFNCQNCGSVVVASRYAPHLEKCMGKGRTASRAASRALASQQNARRLRASPAPSSGTATPPPSLAGGAASTEGGLGTGSSGGLGEEGGADDSSEESDDEAKDSSYGPGGKNRGGRKGGLRKLGPQKKGRSVRRGSPLARRELQGSGKPRVVLSQPPVVQVIAGDGAGNGGKIIIPAGWAARAAQLRPGSAERRGVSAPVWSPDPPAACEVANETSPDEAPTTSVPTSNNEKRRREQYMSVNAPFDQASLVSESLPEPSENFSVGRGRGRRASNGRGRGGRRRGGGGGGRTSVDSVALGETNEDLAAEQVRKRQKKPPVKYKEESALRSGSMVVLDE